MKTAKQSPRAAEKGSLWQSVTTLLLQRIRTGKYPVGQPLPRELDLAEELKVSRNTVREAMRVLANDGLVLRKKRAGTIVLSSGHDRPIRFNVDPLQSLERLHQSTSLRVAKRQRSVLPPGVIATFPAAQEGKWPRLTLVRHALADGRPLSSTEVFLHPRLESLVQRIDQKSYSVFRLIEQETGERVKRIDTVITPCQLTGGNARTLSVEEGSLGLVVSRRMVTHAGELIEVSETMLPAGRYELEVSYTLNGNARAESSAQATPSLPKERARGAAKAKQRSELV